MGLVGAGYVSEYHKRALQRLPQVTIAGICDLDMERARAAGKQFGVDVFPSLKAMAEGGLDAVHVLTPPSAHTVVTLEALSLGCHVLVEKPLATTVEDCDRIAAAARQAGKTVGVNHSLLYDPFVVRALDVVRSGALGDLLTVDYFRSSDYPPWKGGVIPPQYREGGYPFRDLGVHALYLMAALLGDIQDVRAEFSTRGGDPNLLCDEWRAVVRCARGSGQFQLSWNVRPLQSNLVVQGTRGVMRADLFSMAVTVRRSTPMPKAIERAWHPLSDALGIGTQVPGNVLRFLRKKILPFHGLQMMVAAFYEALAAGRPAPATVEQARPIVEWTERIAREADTYKKAFLASFPQTLTATTLVTGASGFLGKKLVKRLLESNERIRIFVRREPPAEIRQNPQIEVVLGDLGDPAAVDRAVAGTKLIYHLGAAMSGGPHDFERGTVAGTRHLIDSVLRHGSPRIVYISSLSVLHAAAARPGDVVREDWPLEPHADMRGSYTQAKLEAEGLVVQAVKEKSLQAIILRPGQIFGPGAPLMTPAVARQMGHRLVILGNGQLVLPLIYVEDVVDAVLLAAQAGRFDGTTLHLVDSVAMTQENYAQEYLKAAPAGMAIIKVPMLVVNTLALGVEILCGVLKRAAPLSRYRVASALAPLRFDCTAAEKVLGWKPRVGVKKGLETLLCTTSAGGSSHTSP